MAQYWGNKKVSLYLGDKRVKLSIGPAGGLPAGYTELEYIGFTGTQYIDTGFVPNQLSRAKFVGTTTEKYTGGNEAWCTLFGSDYAANSNAFSFWINDNSYAYGPVLCYDGQAKYDGNLKGIDVELNRQFTAELNQGHFTLRYNDSPPDAWVYDVTSTITPFVCPGSLLLGALKRKGALLTTYRNHFLGKIYAFKLWDDGTLVRNLIPAKRNSDGAVGMYDTVTGEFLTNAGTGEFIPGYKLPEEYIPLSYIHSSGTQRIDTDVIGAARWIVTALSGKTTAGTQVVISGTNNANAGTWYGVAGTNWACGNVASSTIPQTTKATADLTFDTAGVRGTINDQSVARDIAATPAQWVLFHTKGSDSFTGNVYQAIAYQNNTMVAHLIPAQRVSDSTLGLYDLVANKFFTNVGTGSFTEPTTASTASLMSLSMDEMAPEAEIQDEPQEDLEQE